MQQSEHFNMNLPEGPDHYNVEDFNSNTRVIDEKMYEFENHTLNKNNPHGVTKTQLGLENVENKSSAMIRGELTSNDVENALGYTAMNIDGSNAASEVVFSGAFTVGSRHPNGTIGTCSVVEGENCRANGDYSHAEGSSHSYSDYSHAEGYSTVANGLASHSEGRLTKTDAECAHAEGYMSQSTADYAHAEGWKTIASGSSSHAEGGETRATSSFAHAEGGGAHANGPNSHAEGGGTVADGEDSHAEGYQTLAADARATHAEGQETKANWYYCHAEGYKTEAGQPLDNGETGTAAHAEGYLSKATKNYSHAEGHDTTASGIAAHSEGGGTEASGDYSHAEGDGTWARSRCSHTEGTGCETQSDGYANSAHAEGHYTYADGQAAHAEGMYTKAAFAAHAEGRGMNSNNSLRTIQASGYGSHAEGFTDSGLPNAYKAYIKATAEGSHAEGYVYPLSTTHDANKIASGVGSHAEGAVEGGTIQASGHGAHAEGNTYGDGAIIIASGSGSHAEGAADRGTITASGKGSHAEGYTDSVSSGVDEITTASGNGSHAEGRATTAAGDYSHAEGRGTVAQYEAQHVGGKYNSNKSTTLFEVGNGTSDSARSNAFEVYADGYISQNDGVDKYKFASVDGHNGYYTADGLFHGFGDGSGGGGSDNYDDLYNKPQINGHTLNGNLSSSDLDIIGGAYEDATQSTHGLMSTSDKTKLDGIANNANNYSHPTGSGFNHIPTGGQSGQVLGWSADGTARWITPSGGGTGDGMATDGSNADTDLSFPSRTVSFGFNRDEWLSGTVYDLSKPAGENQTITFTTDMTMSGAVYIIMHNFKELLPVPPIMDYPLPRLKVQIDGEDRFLRLVSMEEVSSLTDRFTAVFENDTEEQIELAECDFYYPTYDEFVDSQFPMGTSYSYGPGFVFAHGFSLGALNMTTDGSVAIGEGCNAGNIGIATGLGTEALGLASHAEGDRSIASGDCSHAGGRNATASRANQFVQGGGSNKLSDLFSCDAMAASGFQPDATCYSENIEITDGQCGCGGCISQNVTMTIDLEPLGMYSLYCSSFASDGSVYGSVYGMITATGNGGSPTWLPINQTSADAVQIQMIASDKISIQNTQTGAQFHLIRIM